MIEIIIWEGLSNLHAAFSRPLEDICRQGYVMVGKCMFWSKFALKYAVYSDVIIN